MPEEIRSFVALELPDEVKIQLVEIQGELKRQMAGMPVRWVDPYGIHLTLKFLGNVPGHQIDAIGTALEQACIGVEPFTLMIGALGCFPNLSRPNVVWIGIGGDLERLRRLQGQIEKYIAPLGYPTEKRDFKPHLTLGRIKNASPGEVRRIGEIVQAADVGTVVAEWTVREVSLMRSDLSPAGAKYTRLKKVELGTKC